MKAPIELLPRMPGYTEARQADRRKDEFLAMLFGTNFAIRLRRS